MSALTTPKKAVASKAMATPSSAERPSVVNKSEDISVICRVRPVLPDESAVEAVKVIRPNSIEVKTENAFYDFAFDAVFDQKSTQSDIFERIGRPVVDCILDGFNATVFAYGQTSAGKTHTMVGTNQDPGFVFRFAQELFSRIENSPEDVEYSVQTQYVEIYLEKVRDLIEERNGKSLLMKQNLQIREDPTHGVHIPDATTKYVCSADELLEVCDVARTHRATSETLMNQVSSRSHSVLLLLITQRDVNTGATKTSKVNLVDLAGSEAVKRSGAEGDRLTEAQAINSSLSALGNVIHALTNDKTTYVPYRDSKLTRLLQESLGGNAKTWLVVNISPSAINAVETVSTLRFGQRAKAVKNRAVVNQIRSAQELEQALRRAEEIIAQQESTIESLRQGKSNDTSSVVVDEFERKIKALERERDEARDGWERSREQAASNESEMQREIESLKAQVEQGLMKLAEFEFSQRNSHDSTTTTTTTTKGNDSKRLPSELRLEQLVQVHRQLLRKYAHLELVVADAKRAIAEGDEKIQLLTKELANSSLLSRQHSRMAKVVRGGGTASTTKE